jgi:FlaA1/EpsC-like NDP-sugar epimerase
MRSTLPREVLKILLARRVWFIASAQAVLILCSLLLAWLIRFDFTLPDRRLLLWGAIVLIVIRLAALRLSNLHRGWWHYTGITDGVDVIRAVALGSVIFFLATKVLPRLASFPRSVLVLEPVLTIALLAGIRLLSRVTAETVREDLTSSKRVLIAGAGFAAQQIIREMRRPGSGCTVLGCADDDPSKHGIRIHGIPVLGSMEELPQFISEYHIDEVLIAVPSATGIQMQRFIEICNRSNVKFRTVPALKDIIAGEVTVSQIREVKLDDLLGRQPVKIDLDSVRKQIAGQTVAVTGAAGSIGSELCHQILEYGPTCLICLDQNETGLFFLQMYLSGHKNGAQVVICVVDLGDSERMRRLLGEYKPAVIFHAAAYKHVPLMEQNVPEAVNNNILVLLDLLDLAEEAGCRSFVLISSDKAVNPSSVMGATKRICELILSSRPANGMRCVSVRFGNVLGSSGSVIPVFKQQLRDNQPLTITDPKVKRFFMITSEAVALVLQAFVLGSHGDILVLDMGDPMLIVDLARNLIRLSGKSEDAVTFRFTGLRPGEKFEEELFYHTEEVVPTTCEKIKRAGGTLTKWCDLQRLLNELRLSTSQSDTLPIRAKLKEIVPEYLYDSSNPRTSGKSGDDSSDPQAMGRAAGQG